MPIIIPSNRTGIDAFAMNVDINGFTKMVSHPEANMMAQFTRDALIGSIGSVEKCHGEVVSFMGDAFCSILFDSEMVWECCLRIAKDIKNQTEYISSNSEAFRFAQKRVVNQNWN